jgi:hypothetical protein
MSALDNISILDLYFLAGLVDRANLVATSALDKRLKPTRGDGWQARFKAAVDAYRAAVETYLKEAAEASFAGSAAAALLEQTGFWRRAMESVVREEKNPARRNALLRAVGFGWGSPRSSKELKDFYLEIGSAVAANEQALLALGADPAAIAFGKKALSSEEEASLKLMKERAEADAARGDVQARYVELVDFMRSVFRAAGSAREFALFAKDVAAQKEASEVLGKLDAAVAQAKVESRARSEQGGVPAEVVTPVVENPVVENPGPNGGVG